MIFVVSTSASDCLQTLVFEMTCKSEYVNFYWMTQSDLCISELTLHAGLYASRSRWRRAPRDGDECQ